MKDCVCVCEWYWEGDTLITFPLSNSLFLTLSVHLFLLLCVSQIQTLKQTVKQALALMLSLLFGGWFNTVASICFICGNWSSNDTPTGRHFACSLTKEDVGYCEKLSGVRKSGLFTESAKGENRLLHTINEKPTPHMLYNHAIQLYKIYNLKVNRRQTKFEMI